MRPVTPLRLPEAIDRLAQRQPNEQVKIGFTIMTGVLLGALVMKEVKNAFRDDSRDRSQRDNMDRILRELNRREERAWSR
jgi:hypothetical protein